MRKTVTLIGCLATTLALGCSSNTPNNGAADMAMLAPGDMAAAAQDMANAGNDLATSPDLSSAFPTNPANAQTVTTGQTITGQVPLVPVTATEDVAHYYKYIPASAYTSVTVNTPTFRPFG